MLLLLTVQTGKPTKAVCRSGNEFWKHNNGCCSWHVSCWDKRKLERWRILQTTSEAWKNFPLLCHRLVHCLRLAQLLAIDLSQNALDFGHKIGLYDTTICSNLNNEACPNRQAVSKAVSKADVFVLSGTICYLNTVAVDMVLKVRKIQLTLLNSTGLLLKSSTRICTCKFYESLWSREC